MSPLDPNGPVSSLRTAIDDHEAAFSTWKPLERWGAYIPGDQISNSFVYLPVTAPLADAASLVRPNATAHAHYAAYIDPAKLDAGARAVKVRGSVRWRVNNVAPGVSISAAIYAVTGFSGGSGSVPWITTLGAAQGLQTLAAPAANAAGVLETDPVTIAAAGDYVIGFTIAGASTPATNSRVGLRVNLDYQQS